jgi:hypothetical protein
MFCKHLQAILVILLCVSSAHTEAPQATSKKTVTKGAIKEEVGEALEGCIEANIKLQQQLAELQHNLCELQRTLLRNGQALLENSPPYKKAERPALVATRERLTSAHTTLETLAADLKVHRARVIEPEIRKNKGLVTPEKK